MHRVGNFIFICLFWGGTYLMELKIYHWLCATVGFWGHYGFLGLNPGWSYASQAPYLLYSLSFSELLW